MTAGSDETRSTRIGDCPRCGGPLYLALPAWPTCGYGCDLRGTDIFISRSVRDNKPQVRGGLFDALFRVMGIDED